MYVKCMFTCISIYVHALIYCWSHIQRIKFGLGDRTELGICLAGKKEL